MDAGAGIGQALAHTFTRTDAVVWVVDRDLAAALATVEAILYSRLNLT